MTNDSRPLYYRGYKTQEWNGSPRRRRVTLAGLIEESEDGKTLLKIGVAECCNRDQFVKETGRRISAGRAFKKPIHILESPVNVGKDFNAWCRVYCDDDTTLTDLGLDLDPAPVVEAASYG